MSGCIPRDAEYGGRDAHATLGITYGETDEFGHKAVTDVVKHHDCHATLLHLFGLDHTKLTFKRNGADVSLTDNQGGRVVKEILA